MKRKKSSQNKGKKNKNVHVEKIRTTKKEGEKNSKPLNKDISCVVVSYSRRKVFFKSMPKTIFMRKCKNLAKEV
jgi:hypothetical protein